MATVFSLFPPKVEIESMEEYSEAKTCKSKPELRKSNVKADLFLFIGGNNYCQSHGVCPGVC